MGNPVKPSTIEKVLKKVLSKKATEPLKLSKIQSKVHKKLLKSHKELTEQQTQELLKDILATSRVFAFDGKKVQLATDSAAAPAAPTALQNGDPADHKRKRHEDDSHKLRKKQKKVHKHVNIKHKHDADKVTAGIHHHHHQQQQHESDIKQQKGTANAEHHSQQEIAAADQQQQLQSQQHFEKMHGNHYHHQQEEEEQGQHVQKEEREKTEKKHKGKHKEKHTDKQQQQQQRDRDTACTAAAEGDTGLAAAAAEPTDHQQQQQLPASEGVAAASQRAQLLAAMQGIRKQVAPAAAASATPKQQSTATKPAAGRHTVLAPPPAGAAVTALAAVQGRLASHQQREEGDTGDSPDKKQQRRRKSDTWRADYNRTDIKHGPFSEAERQAIHAAVQEFAVEKGLPHEKGGCDWLVDRKQADLKRGAITAIAAAVPHRTRKAVWQFVQANYATVEAEGVFTADEDAKLLELYAELGPRWKEIGGRMGRLDRSVRDRAKVLNYGRERVTGRWSEEEVDTLQSFVAAYRQALAASGATEGAVRCISKSLLPDEDAQPRPVGSVQLDDIDWEWVSSQMGTRTAKQCSERWHKRMAPGMIESGQWAPGNDITMITALAAAGVNEAFQVDWGQLVPGRTSQQCMRRWRVILRHLPVEVRKDFSAAVAEAAGRVQQKLQKKEVKKKKGGGQTAP